MALTDLTRLSTSGIATGTSLSGAILHGDAHFRGDQVGINSALFDSSENRLDFKDNVKLRFGDSGDLSLSHNINDSVISHSAAATGALKILSGGAQSIECIKAGAVNIAHNGSTKIQTTSTGTVVTGVLTATSFSGPIVGHANNTSGISTFYNLRVSNDLTVEGTTTTLDTNLVGVDRIEVGANSNTVVGVAITQSGTADIFNLYDGSTEVFSVADGGTATFTGAIDANSTLEVSGIANFDSTVKVADKIEHLGDSNTNIRFPAADTISMETAGSQHLYLASNGNLGIGTGHSNPTSKLHVVVDGVGEGITIGNKENLYNAASTGYSDITFSFYDYQSGGSSGAPAIIRAQSHNAYATSRSSKLIFLTSPSDGTNTPTEKMRIEHDGKVGFGTDNPQRNVHIHQPTAANSYLHMTNSTTGATTTDGFSLYVATDGQTYYRSRESTGTHVFYTGTTEKLRITSGGTIQIGGANSNSADIDASNTKLIIKQSANSQEDGIYIERSGERRGWYQYVGGGLSSDDALCFNTNQLGTDTEVLALDRSGAVKIGSKLIVGTTSGPGQPGLYLGDGTNPAGHIYANGTHHMYILANAYHDGAWKYLGNGEAQSLSITDGDFSFHTAGNNTSGAGQALTWTTRMTVSSNQNVYINGSQTGNDRAILYNGSSYFGIYGSSDGSTNRELRFHTAGGSASERMRLSSDGIFLVNCQDTGYSGSYTNMTIGNASASNTGLTIASSPTNGYSRLHFADATSGAAQYAGFIAYAHGTDAMVFGTGNSGTSKLTLNSDGAINFGSAGDNYSSGGAINLIDFGSGTLNRGMGWGGTNANYANIWTEYSSGAFHIGMGIRPTGTSTGWVSSYGGGSIGRSALKMDLNGDISIFTASGSTIAQGGATNLTQKWFLHRNGGVTNQFAGRNGHVIGSTDGSGAYFLLDGEAGGAIASGADYMYMEHTSTGQFEMWNGKTGVSVSKFMDVSPEGWINTPKQPHCSVTLDANRTVSSNGVHRFHTSSGFGGHYFTAVNANIGGHYDSSNSRFTVPVSGRYLITMNLAVSNSSFNAYGAWEWWINGARGWLGGWQRSDTSGYHRLTSSTVLYLTKDDYLEPAYELHQAVTCQGSNNSWEYTGFTITLLL